MEHESQKGFEILCNVLLKSTWTEMPDFEELCRQIGESPVEMENMLYKEFGMSAEDLISELKIERMRMK